jgi:putative N6-adenine-specific DNA methylase
VSIQFHAKTYKGFEELLAQELREIGAEQVRPVNRGVNFSGSLAMMYKANLYLRTALRVLMPVKRFKALNEEHLYTNVKAIDWSEYMDYKNSFAIDAVSFSKIFRNSHFVAQKVKDAIADQFREKTGFRPSIHVKDPEIRINVHIQETSVLVSLDSSGDSLHKRGYKKFRHEAQLSEVLAAGLVMMTGYKGERDFENPMCGSGTLALEAAMIACDIYPGMIGRPYGFQHWKDYDESMFQRLMEQMPEPKEPEFRITASDIDSSAVRIAKGNARSLGLEKIVAIRKQDFTVIEEEQSPCLLMLNPPYGEKLKMVDIDALYAGIGASLKHRFPGSSAWLLSSNLDALKHVGLKPEKRIDVMNAGLEAKFLNYNLFSGSRKEFKAK